MSRTGSRAMPRARTALRRRERPKTSSTPRIRQSRWPGAGQGSLPRSQTSIVPSGRPRPISGMDSIANGLPLTVIAMPSRRGGRSPPRIKKAARALRVRLLGRLPLPTVPPLTNRNAEAVNGCMPARAFLRWHRPARGMVLPARRWQNWPRRAPCRLRPTTDIARKQRQPNGRRPCRQ